MDTDYFVVADFELKMHGITLAWHHPLVHDLFARCWADWVQVIVEPGRRQLAVQANAALG